MDGKPFIDTLDKEGKLECDHHFMAGSIDYRILLGTMEFLLLSEMDLPDPLGGLDKDI